MADLGTVGTYRGHSSRAAAWFQSLREGGAKLGVAAAGWRKSIVLDGGCMVLGTKETAEGNAQPCLRMDAAGKLLLMRWVVQPGTRTIQIQCKQVINLSPRPSLVIKANPEIGINSDVTAVAGSSPGWVTISTSITPVSAGAVFVEVWNNYNAPVGQSPCYWDNVATI